MLLTDSNFELTINNHKLNCNFRFLRNLYNYVGTDPIQFLFDYINDMDKDDLTTNVILQCMSNELINFSDLLEDEEDKAGILLGLTQLISACFTIKTDNKKEKNSNDNSKADNIDDKFDFESWFNKWYYFARFLLHMTEEEFLDTNITTLSELEKTHMDYQKSILISSYIDIENAKSEAMKKYENNKNSTKDNKKETVITKNNGLRLKDFL